MLDRRQLLRNAALLGLALPGTAALLGGCRAPLVSSKVHDPANGRPWQCQYCGHLTRSDQDLSGESCPRCWHEEFEPISEKELEQALAAQS